MGSIPGGQQEWLIILLPVCPQLCSQDVLRGILTKKSFLKFLQDGTDLTSSTAVVFPCSVMPSLRWDACLNRQMLGICSRYNTAAPQLLQQSASLRLQYSTLEANGLDPSCFQKFFQFARKFKKKVTVAAVTMLQGKACLAKALLLRVHDPGNLRFAYQGPEAEKSARSCLCLPERPCRLMYFV